MKRDRFSVKTMRQKLAISRIILSECTQALKCTIGLMHYNMT
jgi:hypothetical protein